VWRDVLRVTSMTKQAFNKYLILTLNLNSGLHTAKRKYSLIKLTACIMVESARCRSGLDSRIIHAISKCSLIIPLFYVPHGIVQSYLFLVLIQWKIIIEKDRYVVKGLGVNCRAWQCVSLDSAPGKHTGQWRKRDAFFSFLIIIVTIYATITTVTVVVLLAFFFKFFMSLSLTHKDCAVYYNTGHPTGYPARGCADSPIVRYTPDTNVHGTGAVLK